jgi:hypothetical protein
MTDFQTPEWRDKGKIGNLMNRLYKHCTGEDKMSNTQLGAAKLYLAKTLPDLSSMTMANEGDGKFKIEVTMNVKNRPGDTGSVLPATGAETV